MKEVIKIGTRESQLAVWQARHVQNLLQKNNVASELVYIKSEGDVDTLTPLYELGVQGIFTKTLDVALLNHRIDIAVHSMKDVPTKMAEGIKQAAVLERASYKDILVYKNDRSFLQDKNGIATIATSSIRRMAQWLHQYPNHTIENLRGNVNTRLRKLDKHNWNGAIFAAAGLERIDLRPETSVDLDWMLPSPAQGAIIIVCRVDDDEVYNVCNVLNDGNTALCTKIEKDFLRALSGGCSTPISGLAELKDNKIIFKGNICSTDGRQIIEIEKESVDKDAGELGFNAGNELLQNGEVQKIIAEIKNAKK
ncbi:MAG TPA: hydroxymethylbilane synthase [Chitinophagaceae bacterium]|nr:hydroxymethylbilane synthase [Chitinophagaceae bacterium]